MKNSKDVDASQQKEDCFVIMPIADVEGYTQGHFRRVYEDIFKIACIDAGYNPTRADEVKQTNFIHLDILQKLIDSPMAICDLSTRNPNVLFELGLRQAFDKPTVLVQEIGTQKIFDISPFRYTEYRKELIYRDVLLDQKSISDALKATRDASQKGDGVNSIVSLLSLSSPAALKEGTGNDATRMLQIVMSEMNDLRSDFMLTVRKLDDRQRLTNSERKTLEISYAELAREAYSKFRYLVSHSDDSKAIKKSYDDFQGLSIRVLNTMASDELRAEFTGLLNQSEMLFAQFASRVSK